MKEKILVTGGAGYIGSILVPTLLAKGYSVTVLDSLLFNQASLLDCCVNPNFNFIKGDICDEILISSLIPKFDIVIQTILKEEDTCQSFSRFSLVSLKAQQRETT